MPQKEVKAAATFIKFMGDSRAPVERLAVKIAQLRSGPESLPLPLPATVLEAVHEYEKIVDRQLKAKGVE